jgi:putative ABC transport system permease protein
VCEGTERGDYRTVVGTGVTREWSSFNVAAGRSFASGDDYFANGSYDGAMSGEVLLDRETADRLCVSVGETIHAGGTLTAASRHTFTVVGISNDVTGYVGTPSVVFHLAELQTISSSTRTDPASTIVVAVEDEAAPTAVAADLRGT